MHIVAADDLLLVSAHSDDDGTSRLSLCGELDCSNVAQVANVLHQMLDAGRGDVTVDVSALRYIDSTGVAMFLHERRFAAKQGLALHVTGISGVVERVFDVLGVTQLLVA